MFETAEYHFYAALSHAASCASAVSDRDGPASSRLAEDVPPSSRPTEYQQHFEALAAHQEQQEIWAKNCPENFENRVALVGAEIARVEGRVLDAEHLYKQAIRSSRANGFVQNEALANELAAGFYAGRGFEVIAHAYLRKARYCYLRWGADGKVRQLDELYPHLREAEPVLAPTSTIGTSVEHLDLATVMKVSQAVSGEIVLEKLIDALMHTAIEHAGAERGLLILARDHELRIEAEATTSGDTIMVRVREASVGADTLPESIVHYVLRTQESVLLDDAAADNPFSADTYVRQQHARSILCLPLVNQAKLIGLLYLENNLTSNVFTPTRIAVLKLLASQAAISLENARLYRALEEREAKIRRLVDANIVGILIFNLEGEITEANEAFLQMVGYSREDLLSGRLRWTDLTPAEWRYRDERAVIELKATGIAQPFEKEYFRKDGSRVPVAVGGAIFERSGIEGVAFVLDLSEQKHAEDERQLAQDALHQAQTELAHVSRVTTMGELAASIAHEVNQPLVGVVTNASASLRLLAGDSPNLVETREAIRAIIRDGNRAADVISRMRALFKKARPVKEQLNINDAIEEVVVLTRGEARRNKVALRMELAPNLPLIMADRVQVQQVAMNLILNGIEAMRVVEERGRDLVIRTHRHEGDQVLVAVQDSGIGLDPGNVERIFDAFHTTKPGGMGMGLSISRSIVESHGGRLWATPNDGPGATFQFTL
jgi:PAS domain S-box-containing protein